MWDMGWWRRTARFHPYALDAAAAVGLFAISIGEPLVDPSPTRIELSAGEIAFSAMVCTAVALRRRWPLPVLAFCSAATAASIAFGAARNLSTFAVVIAVYTVAATTNRATAVVAGTFTALLLVAGAIYSSSNGSWLDSEKIVLALWSGLATAVGDAVRNHRDYIVAVEERATRAEQSREEEARRRVAEDRLRIARDLHDVMAHNIALINVQAGVAGHVLRTNPEAAEQALGHVRQAGRAALDELGTVLGVLRQSDDTAAPTEPTPTLNRLQELVDSFHRTGLAVKWRLSGQPYPLAPAVDLAAYRVVQESLTNVHKHGGESAQVRLGYQPDELTIVIENDAPPGEPAADPVAGTGHGLLGMRERVTAVGGTMHAGPVPGGFRVRAVLPARQEKTP
ncbi:sensor histidine kinase [Micromonospora sp. NBC_01796]|uniref:sensor histidine kinase n=1 Tax=Micromonospora sp. NBC_01796 TaxID=2975987 RepID=UPI002DD7A425|nr:sensor histidine kinase [Micromonospora sp. NBC_01796]WSA85706.1 sensor histidine kinase [Micromonospora sp. NBC_01796]